MGSTRTRTCGKPACPPLGSGASECAIVPDAEERSRDAVFFCVGGRRINELKAGNEVSAYPLNDRQEMSVSERQWENFCRFSVANGMRTCFSFQWITLNDVMHLTLPC